MRTIILAAGTSQRLRPLTTTIPKTLLLLGEKTLLEHILDATRSSGLLRVDIVTGHGHTAIEECSRDYTRRHPDMTIRLLYNDSYDSTGNIVSFAKAQEVFDEDFIIINSDTIFHKDLLKKLIDSPHANAMLVDDVKRLGAEEMKVHIGNNESITHIHKSLDPETAAGEYVGIMKLSAAHKHQLLSSLTTTMAADSSLYYEDALQTLITDHGVTIHKISTDGLPVMEIDTHEDLAAAKQLITQL